MNENLDYERERNRVTRLGRHRSSVVDLRRALLAGALLWTVLLPARPAEAEGSRRSWEGFGRDPQHTALAGVRAQRLDRIRWQTPVDLLPQYTGDDLFIHYGSPLITSGNTVIVPVKTGAAGGFQVEGRRGRDGELLWTQPTDYALPPHGWTPSFSPALSRGRIWIPGGGGVLYTKTALDAPKGGSVQRIVFYGLENYLENPDAYLRAVYINTPITADDRGNIFFGFQVTRSNPLNLRSGIARISPDGSAVWVAAVAAAGDPTMTKVAHNSAPALSNDGGTLYIAVNRGFGSGGSAGYLLALDSRTLVTVDRVRLKDPGTGFDALVYDDGTASSTVGPDGDVYFGVLENPFFYHHARGWLLHFDGELRSKPPNGSFGWDDTASIVPSAIVPSYQGASLYLLVTKYNNYAQVGGDGVNRMAVLDPNDQMMDPISGVPVMREVLTVAGPTPDEDFLAFYPNAVREWCINTAAVDPSTGSVLVNSEDGLLYRWDLTTGALSESIVLTPGIGEAYTPTVIGADGTVYAINNALLFAVGE